MARAVRRRVATYEYVDAAGHVLRRKIRYEPKTFMWETRSENGWFKGQGDGPQVLYRLPEVERAVKDGDVVTVCEGEKDVETLRALGMVATCSPHNGSWPDGLALPLAGADVDVYRDADEDGKRRARWTVEALRKVGARVRVFVPGRGKDVTELLEAGLNLDAMDEENPDGVRAAPGSVDRYAAAGEAVARIGGNEGTGNGLVERGADLSKSQRFRFAWDNRVLLGYMNLLVGEEGIGKGNLAAWIAAMITVGKLPGDLRGEPAAVAFIGDEDSWDNIWVPRLAAAGADLDLCRQIVAGPEGVVNVKKDAERLEERIKTRGYRLMYFDQLLDNIGYTDNWKDSEVRSALAPLRAVADRTQCAMVLTLHPNKRGGSFRDRVSGTPAFNALSRSSLYLARHPEEEGRVVVVRPKGNYNVEPPAFEFEIEGTEVQGAEMVPTSRIVGQGETDFNKSRLFEAGGTRDSQLDEAVFELQELFADGKARSAREVLEYLGAHGIGKNPAQKARKKLGIKTSKNGSEGGWTWTPLD